MGYFSFVSPDLEDDPTDPNGENPPTKPKSAQQILAESTPGEAQEYQPYSQRRGETTNKVFQAADAIIDKHAASPWVSKEAVDQAKREVRADPANAAKAVEKFFKHVGQAEAESSGLPGADSGDTSRFYGPDFTNLENSVRSIRGTLRSPEEKNLQAQIAAEDLPMQQKQLENLKSQLERVTADLANQDNAFPEAVSEYGERQRQKAIAGKQQEAAALSEHIRQLEAQTGQAQQTVNAPPKPEPTTTQETPNLDLKGDIDSNIKASGRDPRDFRLAMVAAAKTLEEKTGLDTMALKDRVPFQRALLSALQIFDPAGIIVSQLAQDMQPIPSGSGEVSNKTGSDKTKGDVSPQPKLDEASIEEDRHTQNIRRMQADRRALYNELGQTPELQNWLGVMTFVFLSVITRSPAVAASILGISRRQGNLKMQLDLIEKEMHEEGDMLKESQRRSDVSRKLAAEHSLRRTDKAEDFQLELQKMYLNHKLILEREAKRNPENRNAYKQLENSFVRQKSFYDKAQHKRDEAQRILSNDFSDDALKQKAQIDMNSATKEMKFYESRLRDLDLEIRRQSGIQFQDEVPQEANP